MKTYRGILYYTATVLALALMLWLPQVKAADNYIAGYDFNSSTGLHSGADLEDLVTMTHFASTAFDPSNTNRLFDTTTVSGKLAGTTWVAYIPQGGIGSNEIAQGAVDSGDLAASSVTSQKLGNAAISTRTLQKYVVTASNLDVSATATNASTNFLKMVVTTNGGTNVTMTLAPYSDIQNVYYAAITNDRHPTTPVQLGKTAKVIGWSQIVGPATGTNTWTNIPYGVTFATNPIILMQLYNYGPVTSGPPASLSMGTAHRGFTNDTVYHAGSMLIHPHAISNDGFSAQLSAAAITTGGNNFYFMFMWTAEGEIP